MSARTRTALSWATCTPSASNTPLGAIFGEAIELNDDIIDSLIMEWEQTSRFEWTF